MSADPGTKIPRGWVPAITVLVVIVAATALVLMILPRLPGPVGPGGSVLPSPSWASDYPTTAPSMPTSPYPTTAPSIPTPLEGWTLVEVAGNSPYAKIVGIVAGPEAILAFGQADIHRLGVWRSFDGKEWQAETVPELPVEFGGRIVDIVTKQEGFVGLASLGDPEGSGPITSAIYTSPDGSMWTSASDPVDGSWNASAIAVQDQRIVVAGGSGVFVSDDGGNSWQQLADVATLGGQITDLVADGSRLVAVGYSGSFETAQPLLWASTDGGATWDQTGLGDEGSPSQVLIGPDGTIVVFGATSDDAVVWRLDGYGWSSQRVASCCLVGATITPTGYVAVGYQVVAPSAPYVASSSDARAWKLEEEPGVGELTGVGWAEQTGLLVTTPSFVVSAPSPYP